MTLYCFDKRNGQRSGFAALQKPLKLSSIRQRWMKSSWRMIACTLCIGCLLSGTAYAHDTVLRGALIIDFTGSQGEISPPGPSGDVKITIPDQGNFAGLRIPRNVDGQPFRGQEFTVSIVPSGCVLDGTSTSGKAQLHLTQSIRREPITGTVFTADVSSGQYECLFGGASQVMPYDPFAGNQQTSVIAELLIWWAQILSNQNAVNNLSVEEEINQYFGINGSHDVHRLRFLAVEYASPFNRSCTVGSKHIHCNRGGSADGLFNADVRVKFKEHELQ